LLQWGRGTVYWEPYSDYAIFSSMWNIEADYGDLNVTVP
jgi:hypothetical protein